LFFYLCFVRRIAFTCLVVCRWQVRHDVQQRGPWQEYETWCRGPGMVVQVGYSVARRSRGRVGPCAVCTSHVETRSAGFLIVPQNQGRRFVSGLASKPLGQFLLVWPQNQWRWFSPVWPQNRCRRFLAVWPQNLLRRFSPVWPQNWWRRFFPVWP
jgi:hypothetical protein